MIDLSRPRDLGQILSTCWALYRQYFRVFAVIALAVVVPMDILSLGLIDGYLTKDFDAEQFLFNSGVAYSIITPLVTTPLITAGHVHAVQVAGEGGEPSAGASLSEAGAVFPRVLGTLVLSLLATIAGFIALIIPGFYVVIRLAVVLPASVAEGRGPGEALSRSWELVKDNWWRTLGILTVLSLLGYVIAALLAIPLAVIAAAADSGALLVATQIAVDTVTLSFVALGTTLLFFELRARHEPPQSVQDPYTPPPPAPLDRPEVPPGA